MRRRTAVAAIVPLAWLTACAGTAEPPPRVKQPSVLDRAVAPAVGLIGVQVSPQGGLVIPNKPAP
jgi:hypothetical protein